MLLILHVSQGNMVYIGQFTARSEVLLTRAGPPLVPKSGSMAEGRRRSYDLQPLPDLGEGD